LRFAAGLAEPRSVETTRNAGLEAFVVFERPPAVL